jgi:hypothetical protein
MGNRHRLRVALLLATIPWLAGARAPAADRAEFPSFLVGGGLFDASGRADRAAEGRVEWRTPIGGRGLRAALAALATTDGSLFVGAGLGYRVGLGRWDVTTSLVPGWYRPGRGWDLGHPVEFRSQVELGYRLAARSRIALGFSHLSNAGLSSSNPGQESVTLSFEWREGAREE